MNNQYTYYQSLVVDSQANEEPLIVIYDAPNSRYLVTTLAERRVYSYPEPPTVTVKSIYEFHVNILKFTVDAATVLIKRGFRFTKPLGDPPALSIVKTW